MVNTDRRIRWTIGGPRKWTLDDGVLKPLRYTGSALPNDHEIIQLTEGSEVEEQQESELATPEMPRELIGYEFIGTVILMTPMEKTTYRVKKVLMWTIKQLIMTTKYNTETVGDDENVMQENNRISDVIILLKYLSCWMPF